MDIKTIESKELFITQLTDSVYLMDEAHESTGYLVVGSERACMIDTMNGFNDLKAAVAKITDKPVFVINTHGHPDHIYGNIYFEECYLNPDDHELADMFKREPEFLELCRIKGKTMPEFKPLHNGDVFDLGDRHLEAFTIGGHTKGGTMLLLREDMILFTGDAINHHLWMQLDGCPHMGELVKELDRVMFLSEKADRILHGHARGFDDISLIRCLRQGAQEICDGETSEDPPYKWFGGEGRMHLFKVEEGKSYSQPFGSAICYRPENV